MEFKNLDCSKVGLVSQDENGVIYQIGLSQDQSDILNAFVASMSSQDKPLLRLPSKYDLILKSDSE